MPEYLAPGVFVEEVSFRAKSIEGVGTSVTAVVGPTRFGPLRGNPEVVTSFGEFARIYGDIQDLTLHDPVSDTDRVVFNHTAIAAKAFFDGGGKQLYVSRVGNFPQDAPGVSTRAVADVLTFSSRFPGAMGDFTLELLWRDSENLLRFEPVAAPAEGDILFLNATGLTNAVRAPGIAAQFPDARFPLNLQAVVRREGNQYVIVDNRCTLDPDDGAAATGTDLRPSGPVGSEGVLLAAGLVNGGGASVTFTRVAVKKPTSGTLADGGTAVLSFNEAAEADDTDISAFTGAAHWGTLKTLIGSLDADASELVVASGGFNPLIAGNLTVPLAALALVSTSVRGLVLRNFDISVHSGGGDGPVVYSYGNLSTAPDAANSLGAVLAVTPDKRYDQLASPISCVLDPDATGTQILAALRSLSEPTALVPGPFSVQGARYLINLTGGNDGNVPAATHYGGVVDEVNGSSGFAALENIEDISIVMTPAAAADAANHQAIVAEVQKHCLRMRYRVGIVDSRDGMTLSEVREFRSNFDDSRLALYYPWVVIADPRGVLSTINVPPAGFVAGVYANTDVQRGVHKPPANEPVIGALRFAQEINRFQQELLNPNGINCLRSFPGRGHRVWGGRTLSSDPEWKYVNVRRYFLYLERSIDKSTQWVVFEPNGERLWDNVRQTVESFLYNEWVNGRLLGSAKTAYFVRCDRSTMTQNDLDNGRLVCEIGVAALKPAEFVIFRIGQKTADA
ncbi:phage tail sheath subtilisin-like domain-containing protein [Methylomonas montana]|uniref:phage tail sheath subtilisin-like domain-containing protein n=1 Tax=Methylomonas montana TaxID=3058963 RepID=UPI0026598DF6|nr:phage tail sheath subtilisin-like domain-containing protein [Methylomonas montana]WKJ90001.1 phage tail sheath subtilisin-like domain-containing protein [Methylomonas montana]